MKNIIAVGIMLLLLIVSLCGCIVSNNSFKSDEDRITGTWFISEEFEGDTRTVTYIFSSNKSYEVILTYKDEKESFNGTWEIIDNYLVVTIEGETLTGKYQFTNNDKTLSITDTESNNITTLTKLE
jgi:hypothetical protein